MAKRTSQKMDRIQLGISTDQIDIINHVVSASVSNKYP